MTQGMHARRRTAPGAATALVLIAAATAAAQPPDVATIVSRMKQAVEPAQSSLRRMTLTVTQEGSTSKVVLGQARGKLGERNRILTVVLAPADLQGTVHAIDLKTGAPKWMLRLASDPAVAAPGMVYGGVTVHGGKLVIATCNLEGPYARKDTAVVCIGSK